MQFKTIILAAGLSTRMGISKLGLIIDGQDNFLSFLVRSYRSLNAKEIFVVGSFTPEQFYDMQEVLTLDDFTFVHNPEPEKGRFLSIKLGLEVACDSCPVFLHNVDNPCFNSLLMKQMVEKADGYDCVVPIHKGKGGHPVLLMPSLFPKILSQTENDFPLNQILKKSNRLMIETDWPGIHVNINTGRDYMEFLKKG
ncbi:MAG: hypothetical protein EOM23_04430 [Candidatus Moranbacteria bacterium]|nr:hypothetical protein [Candidatus Moranbacteria bacterium]